MENAIRLACFPKLHVGHFEKNQSTSLLRDQSCCQTPRRSIYLDSVLRYRLLLAIRAGNFDLMDIVHCLYTRCYFETIDKLIFEELSLMKSE